MSPLRRRSARLASSASSKPKPASNLSSLAERDETPVVDGFAGSASMASPDAVVAVPSTPAQSSPVKPPMGEMHPSKVHPTTAAPSSVLSTRFADISTSARDARKAAGIVPSTPSRNGGLTSSPFTFRLVRGEADQGLSTEALAIMDELREEAAKIKADLAAEREQEKARDDALNGRRIAQPKGKSGRFSAAHIAAFRKMDSIENHASAFRATPGRFTPAAQGGIKRSSSRANLDDPDSAYPKSGLKRSPSKAKLDETSFSSSKNSLKRSPSKSSIEDSTSSLARRLAAGTPSKPKTIHVTDEPPSPAKRAKQRLEDDASSSRPVSRDASFIPRPKSSHSNDEAAAARSHSTLRQLMSPTKSSMARITAASSKPPAASAVKSSSKANPGGVTKSVTTSALASATKTSTAKPRILSPGRFERVKSILRGSKGNAEKAKTAIPVPFSGLSQTPAPPRFEKELPPVPMTSPRRNRLVKRPTVEFTPQTRRSVFMQNSPTTIRSVLPKSKTMRNFGEVQYPTLDSMIMDERMEDVVYPDLSKHRSPLADITSEEMEAAEVAPPTAPGTFTFRSDHTICFGATSPKGFGGSPGQSSVRHVRTSMLPSEHMPGSFPIDFKRSQSNKENRSPSKPIFSFTPRGIPHGLLNKKRHRPTWDEEEVEEEMADRAAKKRRFEGGPEEDELPVPTLVPATPMRSVKKPTVRSAVATPSPTKKRPVLSLNRLNLLAKPKNRR